MQQLADIPRTSDTVMSVVSIARYLRSGRRYVDTPEELAHQALEALGYEVSNGYNNPTDNDNPCDVYIECVAEIRQDLLDEEEDK